LHLITRDQALASHPATFPPSFVRDIWDYKPTSAEILFIVFEALPNWARGNGGRDFEFMYHLCVTLFCLPSPQTSGVILNQIHNGACFYLFFSMYFWKSAIKKLQDC
jgi:hypothetical protein